jgi:hypothetical protein
MSNELPIEWQAPADDADERRAVDGLMGDYDEAPYVCPGCHAVGEEPCLPGCIDDEIETERRDAFERGDYDRMDDTEES